MDGQPVRCFCGPRPLLAIVSVDERGEAEVHVKVWKGSRLYAEIVATSGVVKVRCRNCLRWHRVRIVRGAPALQEIPQSGREQLTQ